MQKIFVQTKNSFVFTLHGSCLRKYNWLCASVLLCVCVCEYVCMCVCESERERESVFVFVCVRERECVCICIVFAFPTVNVAILGVSYKLTSHYYEVRNG